jgi:hypothetical protein
MLQSATARTISIIKISWEHLDSYWRFVPTLKYLRINNSALQLDCKKYKRLKKPSNTKPYIKVARITAQKEA